MKRLPLFPLQLVLLPYEHLPLHIFEPRYKKMIFNAINNQEPFGIVLQDSENIYNFGCEVDIIRVLNEYPSGEYDIIVKGTKRFKIINKS